MPANSSQLEKQKKHFDEIHEIVRVFTLYKNGFETIRVTIVRYYTAGNPRYDAWYERQNDQGNFEDADFGSIINGSSQEETAIRDSIGFVKQALGILDSEHR